MPWQQEVADVTGEVLPNGRFAYPVCVLIVPRRAGKTDLTLATGVQRCSIAPSRKAWYTAQTGTDAATTFRESWVPLLGDSALGRSLQVRKSNGSMGLTLPNKSRFGLFAPTEKALHGQDSDTVTIDEAWAFDLLQGAQLEAAIRPTMATRPARQLWIISAGGTDDSTWLLDWRKLGRSLGNEPDRGVAYFEFHPDGEYVGDDFIVTDDLDDPATWAKVHPAVGHTIDLATLQEDFDSMKRNLFYRSYLDIFTSSDDDDIFPATAWANVQDNAHKVEPGPGLFIGYSATEGLTAGAICIARLQGDRVVAEVIDSRVGTDWMPAELARLRSTYGSQPVADSVGPVTAITRALRDLGIEAEQLDTREYLDACAELLRDVKSETIQLRPQPDLNASVRGVAQGQVGDAWKFVQRRSKGNIAPLLALAVASFKARHHVTRAPMIYTLESEPVGASA